MKLRAFQWSVLLAGALGCAPREEFCATEGEDDAGVTGCIDFDEAAQLATRPYSGVHKLTVLKDPEVGGAALPTARNDEAICRNTICYLQGQGAVSIYAAASPQQLFAGWSCTTQPDTIEDNPLLLGPITKDVECTAHFWPAFIVINATVSGWDGAHVQVSSSGGCSALDSCVVFSGGSMTLTAPSDPGYEFLGWSNCATSSQHTLVLEGLTQAQPTCIASYRAITP